ELQLQVLKQLDNPTLVAADTMNFWIEGSNAALRETLKHVDLLSINDGEARLLSGEYNLRHAAKVIREMGPKILVIKRGEYGALLFVDDEIFSAPAYPLEVIRDPTGAGDTFAGGMLGFLSQQGRVDEGTLRQSIIVGSAMASFVVEDFSLGRMRTLDRSTIEARFKEFNRLTHFDQNGLVVGERG
ncbi:MAG: PfkB family carbohydrate kinase, partial [Myxococcota bacterium]